MKKKREELQKLHAVFSVDTSFYNKLRGIYKIEGYTLRPCLVTEKNVSSGCSNFVLEFDFDGLDIKGMHWRSLELQRRLTVIEDKATQIAKEFVAWLVLATRLWARLSSQSHGSRLKFGPFTVGEAEGFAEDVLETTYHVNKKAENGEFLEIQRPSYSFYTPPRLHSMEGLGTFKLSSDLPYLTRKMFSLREKERDKFLNASFSYQFALENWKAFPTISVLSLVSAVESMMADEYTSGFCKDANRECSLKKDVMKKFKMFFERNLQYPLPREYKVFLNKVYDKRSKYLHKALLGEGEVRGIQFRASSGEVLDLMSEQKKLESLVNATLMEWLKGI